MGKPQPIRPCIVIAGPTASGKTSLAVDLAHVLGSEIFSADSRQVYRGLDLGTGKDLAEYRRVVPAIRHHLIDIVDPVEAYTLFRYQADCYSALEEFHNRKGPDIPAILCGGTGLYLEAVLRRYDIAQAPENPDLRAELMAREADDLREELRRRDPDLMSRTDLSSKKRVVRALEVTLKSQGGEIPRSRAPEWTLNPLIFVTDWERSELRKRIEERLMSRLHTGMVEEVRVLRERSLSWERLDALGMEYRQVASFLKGEKTHAAMVADLLLEIFHLAKRQETWFRGMERRGLKTVFIKPGTTADQLLSLYLEWKSRHAGA
jgi:tRNA dimethylallyltransferase